MVALIMGRRSSKTTLAALIESYEIYRWLREGPPRSLRGLIAGQETAFLNCATSEDQATIHYRMLMGFLDRLDIAPLTGSLDSGLSCLLPQQLRVLSLHSNARTLRGRTAKLVVFDELAHFQRTGGPSSDEEVFRALAPSVRTFGPHGSLLITSSPADPTGILYDLYQARGHEPGTLIAQFATWEFNPHIARADLEGEFTRHPLWAASEYGAQFPSQSSEAFLPASAIRAAITHQPRTPDTLDPSQRYFAHLDIGLVHDRTALAIGHVEHRSSALLRHNAAAQPPSGERGLGGELSGERGLGGEQSRADARASQDSGLGGGLRAGAPRPGEGRTRDHREEKKADSPSDRVCEVRGGRGGPPHLILDLIHTWQGSRESPVRISLIEQWIRDLATRIPLIGISADPYESSLLLERLSLAGLHTRAIPFSAQRKLALYTRLEDVLLSGTLHLPDDPLLIAELTALKRTWSATGAQFAAPRSGLIQTDDCADALVGLLEWLASASPLGPVDIVEGAW